MQAIQVHELTSYIKRTIDMDYFLSDLLVEGEISNLKTYQSGHTYFSLKDQKASIPCILYRWEKSQVSIDFKEGDQVLVQGGISVFEKETRLTLYVKGIEKKGLGALYKSYLATKERLSKEGLFDEKYKQKIPSFVRKIGVVTSRDGAVLRDIVHVLKRRNPDVSLVLYASLVQGNLAVKSLRKSLKRALEDESLDLIIIGRGGGSFEDLVAFQDEDLARDIFCAKIPIISAVGHETDYSISDFVADYRAPTPSAAAEIAVSKKSDLVQGLDLLRRQAQNRMTYLLDDEKSHLGQRKLQLDQYSPKVSLERHRGTLNLNKLKLKSTMESSLRKQEDRLGQTKLQLTFYGPKNRLDKENKHLDSLEGKIRQGILESLQKRRAQLLELGQGLEDVQRSFPYAFIMKNNRLVKGTGDLENQDYVELILRDGSVGARIENKGD